MVVALVVEVVDYRNLPPPSRIHYNASLRQREDERGTQQVLYGRSYRTVQRSVRIVRVRTVRTVLYVVDWIGYLFTVCTRQTTRRRTDD